MSSHHDYKEIFLTPLDRFWLWRIGVAATSRWPSEEGASQVTRIFFSWIADLSVESHFTRLARFVCRRGWATHDLGNVGKLLVSRDGAGLNQELVAASSVGGGFLLHRLEKDCRGQRGSRQETGQVSYRTPRHRGRARCGPSWGGHSIYCLSEQRLATGADGIASNVLLRGRGFDLGFVSGEANGAGAGEGAERRTLNATGEELVFLILRTCATSTVKGPG